MTQLGLLAITVLLAAAGWLVLRRRRQRLLGPIFFFDLVGVSRRGHAILYRFLYGGALLVILLVDESIAEHVPYAQLTAFAEQLYLSFLTSQLVVVCLLAPVYTATAIAEEKTRRTLGFLLASDLSSGEIVMGKLGSRLAQLFLLVLTGLPIVGLLQFLGGVDPNLVLGGFAATAVTALSIGSLGLLLSVYCRRPLTAVLGTYGAVVIYHVITACPGLQGGNFIVALEQLGREHTEGLTGEVVVRVVGEYALFHLGLATIFVVWAIAAFRPVSLRQLAPEPTTVASTPHVHVASDPASDFLNRLGVRPPLPEAAERCVLWKELHVDLGAVRRNEFYPGLLIVFTLLWCEVFRAIFLVLILERSRGAVSTGSKDLAAALQPLAAGLACLLVWLVGLNASGRISRERERATLDSLLTTALTRREILWDKWAASIMSFRAFIAVIGSLCLLRILAAILEVGVAVLWAISAAVYVSFAASLGLYLSARCQTSVRASMLTLIILLVVALVPFFLGETARWLSPAYVLWQTWHPLRGGDAALVFVSPLEFAIAAFFLWKSACARFDRE